MSSDATAPGINVAYNKTDFASYFTDHLNGDFHLTDTSLNLWGLSGTDISATFTTDIDGDTRSNWDIGADEYVTAVFAPQSTRWVSWAFPKQKPPVGTRLDRHHPLAKGLVGGWLINQGGTTIVDLVTGAVTAPGGSVSMDMTEQGAAVKLDGSTGNYLITDSRIIDQLNLGELTVEALVKPTGGWDSSETVDDYIVDVGGSTQWDKNTLYFNDDGRVRFINYIYGKTLEFAQSDQTSFGPEYYHLTGTTSVKKNETKLYVDGKLQALTANANPYPAPVERIKIGGGTDTDIDNHLAGSVALVRIYNRALSAEEVAGLRLNLWQTLLAPLRNWYELPPVNLVNLAAILASNVELQAGVGVARGLVAQAGSVADLSGGVNVTRPLSGTIPGQSDLAPDLTSKRGLSATAQNSSAQVQALTVARGMGTQIANIADISAALSIVAAGLVDLAATLDTVAGLSAALTVRRALAADLGTASQLTPQAGVLRSIGAQLSGAANTVAALGIVRGLQVPLATAADIVGRMEVDRGLTVTIATQTDAAVQLSVLRKISAELSTIAGLAADLATTSTNQKNEVLQLISQINTRLERVSQLTTQLELISKLDLQ